MEIKNYEIKLEKLARDLKKRKDSRRGSNNSSFDSSNKA